MNEPDSWLCYLISSSDFLFILGFVCVAPSVFLLYLEPLEEDTCVFLIWVSNGEVGLI